VEAVGARKVAEGPKKRREGDLFVLKASREKGAGEGHYLGIPARPKEGGKTAWTSKKDYPQRGWPKKKGNKEGSAVNLHY